MELYHLLNRGVDGRKVFLDNKDYLRFVHDLFVFNDTEDADANHRMREFHKPAGDRECLVQIHAFCLMPNHYHLLVSELEEDGMSVFMRKLNMGYAKYFNEKYGRSGVLWQGTFRKILIQREGHFLHVPYYIHLNPLDLKFPEWRDGKMQNFKGALAYLREYRWSSYLDYNGIKNFPSILDMELLADVLGYHSRQEKIMREIVSTPRLAKEANELE